jgi:hypothetical protein
MNYLLAAKKSGRCTPITFKPKYSNPSQAKAQSQDKAQAHVRTQSVNPPPSRSSRKRDNSRSPPHNLNNKRSKHDKTFKRERNGNVQTKYYAVRIGHQPGIYTCWDECRKQIFKYPGNMFASFYTISKAKAYMCGEIERRSPKQKQAKTERSQQREAKEAKRKNRFIDNRKFNVPPSDPIQRRFSKPSFSSQYFQPDYGHIFVDGACVNNDRPNMRSGIGVFFGPRISANVSRRVTDADQTSCRAELLASLCALKITAKNYMVSSSLTTSKHIYPNSFESNIL